MKDQFCIHDYMVSADTVGDWDGQSELVADRVNMISHMLFEKVPDDIEEEKLDELLNSVWEVWCQDDSIVDADEEDILDWIHNIICNL